MAAGDRRSKTETPISAQVILVRRLKTVLFGAVLIPALLLVAAAWDERTQLLRVAEGDTFATVTAMREHASKTILSHELLIRALDSRIQGMSQAEIGASSAALSTAMAGVQVGMPEVKGLAITDADGRLLAGTTGDERDADALLPHLESPIGHVTDGETYISRAYGGLPGKSQDLIISRRHTAPDGTFNVTIHVWVAASYFSDFWAEVTAGRAGVMVGLICLDGEVLARFPEAGNILPLALGGTSAFIRRVQADPQAGISRTTSTPDGIERIYAYSKVGRYPLVVGYGIAVPTVIAPWRQHLLDFGGVGVLVTTALVLAVLATIRQVHRLGAEQDRRIATEQAVQKGQRLELLGQLAAGIAHDFANILQAMGIMATLLKRSADQPERVHLLADRLAGDVERGTSLSQRMLDLVRQNRGRGESQPVDASDLIDPREAMSRVCDLLPRLLGRGYRLRCELPEKLPALKLADRSQLELVIMNLAVNARDAMPTGGEIVIRVSAARADGDVRVEGCPAGLATGDYVRIAVLDNGVGMSPEILAKVGVPFFTTKPAGRGTGLGLAGARSFVELADGRLCIESTEGCGTTVTLWLPAVAPRQALQPRPIERVG